LTIDPIDAVPAAKEVDIIPTATPTIFGPLEKYFNCEDGKL
jgi:hypothetical protein